MRSKSARGPLRERTKASASRGPMSWQPASKSAPLFASDSGRSRQTSTVPSVRTMSMNPPSDIIAKWLTGRPRLLRSARSRGSGPPAKRSVSLRGWPSSSNTSRSRGMLTSVTVLRSSLIAT
jgi:hypothetical protein